MNYSEKITGININVQAVDITIDDDLKETVRRAISRLSRFHNKIEWADVYLEDKKEKSTDQKQVSIRLGIPGNDPFASEYGDNFHALLSEVEDKLRKAIGKEIRFFSLMDMNGFVF